MLLFALVACVVRSGAVAIAFRSQLGGAVIELGAKIDGMERTQAAVVQLIDGLNEKAADASGRVADDVELESDDDEEEEDEGASIGAVGGAPLTSTPAPAPPQWTSLRSLPGKRFLVFPMTGRKPKKPKISASGGASGRRSNAEKEKSKISAPGTGNAEKEKTKISAPGTGNAEKEKSSAGTSGQRSNAEDSNDDIKF